MNTQELPEDKIIFLLLLLADILNTITREIIVLATDDGRTAGLATIITYGVEGLIILIIIQLIYVIFLIVTSEDNPARCFNVIMVTTQIIASMLYYYGDNINFILERYGEDLGCGDVCVENNQIAAVITLGLSLILFQVMPGVLRKIAKMNKDWQYEETGWKSALDMLVVIVKIDTVFTVVAIMAQTDEYCNSTDVGLSSSFVIISFLAGLVAMIVYGVFSCVKLDDSDKTKCITLAFFLLLFCFPMYLLADNQQPIDCAFGCDTFTANMTQNEIDCNMRGSAGLRLGFMGVTLLIMIFVPLGLICGSLLSGDTPDAGVM